MIRPRVNPVAPKSVAYMGITGAIMPMPTSAIKVAERSVNRIDFCMNK
jgi:hypothetical protein